MAEGIFNAIAMETNSQHFAISCGLSAEIPMPAANYAVTAAAEYGADISKHMSMQISASLISGAEAVYCMTSVHALRLAALFPQYAGIIHLMPCGEIPDPYGGSLALYMETAGRIYFGVKDIMEKL